MAEEPREERPKIGRPRTYQTNDDLVEAINNYFQNTSDKDITITGLALALGFESRQSFYDYEKNGDFSYTIKSARLIVENEYEKDLKQGNQSPAAAIFALKNVGNWTDKQEIEQKSEVEITDNTKLKEYSTEDLEALQAIHQKYKSDK
jgi:hypothetical protein